MKNIKPTLLIVLLFALLGELSAQVSTPRIRIQGTLKDAAGVALPNGTQPITFKLFNVSGGGTALWEETAQVSITGGIYSHLLGSVQPLDPVIFAQTLYVGRFMNGKELLPRSVLSASPYALYVKNTSNGPRAGTVIAFAGAAEPDGWLICNGQALSSATYPELYAALGTTFGNGSSGINGGGGKNFNVPDLRGEFVRGLDDSRNLDPGRTIGTVQDAGTKHPVNPFTGTTSSDGAHSHPVPIRVSTDPMHIHVSTESAAPGWNQTTGIYTVNTSPVSEGEHIHLVVVVSGGDAETRPRNVSMNYIIKY